MGKRFMSMKWMRRCHTVSIHCELISRVDAHSDAFYEEGWGLNAISKLLFDPFGSIHQLTNSFIDRLISWIIERVCKNVLPHRWNWTQENERMAFLFRFRFQFAVVEYHPILGHKMKGDQDGFYIRVSVKGGKVRCMIINATLIVVAECGKLW